jgi:DNA-binding NarL/FixJ family response regulator
LVADKEPLFAEGIKALLGEHFEIVGVAADGKALLSANETLKPDFIIADIGMPLLNGIKVLSELNKQSHRVKVIFLTAAADRSSVTEALRAGALGYVLKTSPPEELLAAIDRVLSGGTYITPQLLPALGKMAREFGYDDERRPLTRRETEVLQLVAKGLTTKQIAGALNISTKTVESHRTSISRHLDIHSIAELTRYAMEHGLL